MTLNGIATQRWRSSAILVPALLILCLTAEGQSRSDSRIFRLDARFDDLISVGAQVEKIADGFHWVEGPVWNARENYLLFSDIPANTVYKWREGAGVTPFLL